MQHKYSLTGTKPDITPHKVDNLVQPLSKSTEETKTETQSQEKRNYLSEQRQKQAEACARKEEVEKAMRALKLKEDEAGLLDAVPRHYI